MILTKKDRRIENFTYNGVFVIPKPGFAKWWILEFIKWSNDPGIAIFRCSDGKDRYIPTCQISTKLNSTLSKQAIFKRVIIGAASNSL